MTVNAPSPIRPKRPRRVTFFSLGVLLLGSGLNLARAAWAWRQANALTDLPASTSMPMAWLAMTSLVWGVVFGLCSLGLWRLRRWGRTGTLVAVTLFHAHVWFNHVLFDRSDYARQVWPFSIVHTLAVLLVVWGFLYWPSIRRLYGEQDRLATACGPIPVRRTSNPLPEPGHGQVDRARHGQPGQDPLGRMNDPGSQNQTSA